MREYAFELSLCAHLEATREAVVARQVGGGVHRPGGRVLDVVLVEPGPAFDRRVAITDRSIPTAALAAEVGPGRFRPAAEAIEGPPERVERVTERAVEAGFFERERRGGRTHVRQVVRYPDWFSGLVAVENKPDLGEAGAMADQLRTDASLAVADRVVLATASHVTGAHRNRIPEEVGIWRFDPDRAGDPAALEVLRDPEPLATDEPGVEPLERRPGRTEVRVADPDEKARARRRIAERAYGKGWRPRPGEFPGCSHASEGEVAGGGGIPHCEWKGRIVDPASECGPACPGYDSADQPEVDPEAERDRRTPWVADPEGLWRRQSGLDRFG